MDVVRNSKGTVIKGFKRAKGEMFTKLQKVLREAAGSIGSAASWPRG